MISCKSSSSRCCKVGQLQVGKRCKTKLFLVDIVMRLHTILSLLAVCHVPLTATASTPRTIRVTIKEELPIETVIINLIEKSKADTQLDSNNLDFKIFASGAVTQYFWVNSKTGDIRIRQRIDRDSLCGDISSCCQSVIDNSCILKLTISTDNEYTYIYTVLVTVEDTNDHAPSWSSTQITLQFSENSAVDEYRTLPLAIDQDTGLLSVQRYEIVEPVPSDFHLDYDIPIANSLSRELRIKLRRRLDRETVPSYNFTVAAFDGGEPQRSGFLKVSILVMDENDNPPKFEKDRYTAQVTENKVINSEVIQVLARDPDDGMNGKVYYSISSFTKSNWRSLFMVEPNTGVVRVRGVIDYEKDTQIELQIQAEDRHPTSPKKTTTVLIVQVLDENDNAPYFNMDGLRGKVMENLSASRAVTVIKVEDADNNENGEINCKLSSFQQNFDLKSLGNGMFKLQTSVSLDRETQSKMDVPVLCNDNGQPSRSSSAYIHVLVEDENDNAPIFENSIYHKSVNEDKLRGAYIFSINASDPDAGNNARIRYRIAPSISGDSNDAGAFFDIDEWSGRIRLAEVLDREQRSSLSFVVVATDHGQPKLSGSATVSVTVEDANDNAPQVVDMVRFLVPENQTQGSAIGQLNATDADAGANGQVQFFLDALSIKGKFPFNVEKNGRIILRLPLDREEVSDYHFQVVARDNGRSQLSSHITIHVVVSDINDFAPEFEFPNDHNRSVLVLTSTDVRREIVRIHAKDRDSGENSRIFYSLGQNFNAPLFDIDQENGAISLLRPLTENDVKVHKLVVVAKDGGQPPRQKQEIISLRVVKSNVGLVANRGRGESEQSGGTNNPMSDNLLIIVGLVSITGVFVLLFAIGIAILSCRRWRRQEEFYGAEIGETGDFDQDNMPQWKDHLSNNRLGQEKFLNPGTNSTPVKGNGQHGSVDFMEANVWSNSNLNTLQLHHSTLPRTYISENSNAGSLELMSSNEKSKSGACVDTPRNGATFSNVRMPKTSNSDGYQIFNSRQEVFIRKPDVIKCPEGTISYETLMQCHEKTLSAPPDSTGHLDGGKLFNESHDNVNCISASSATTEMLVEPFSEISVELSAASPDYYGLTFGTNTQLRRQKHLHQQVAQKCVPVMSGSFV